MEKKVAKIIFLDFDGVLNTEYHQRQFCLKLLFKVPVHDYCQRKAMHMALVSNTLKPHA